MADLNDNINDLNEKVKNITDTKDSTAEFDEKDITDNKVMGILAYCSWLVLIPLFGAKESKFARYHVNQGIVLAIASTVVIGIATALSHIPFLGWIFSIVEGLLGVVVFLLSICGIVNAANGKAKELPIIGSIKLFK